MSVTSTKDAEPAPGTAHVNLDSTGLLQLNNSDAQALLDTIDALRELQVGEIVHLPQIIVVGDQSCGKSSVLEAISGVRFPVDGDLCTRFATELVLRRADETAVYVSIQFADDLPDGTSFQQPFRRSSFDKDVLPDIIHEAKELMGIRNEKRFSKDILRVQISGPEVPSLTLVDLPGIFHAATADQDLHGKEIVDSLVSSYMSQPKSIILAVVAANNQLANQIVLRKAQEHDPNRERTIGVITKPDLAGRGSANERKYLDLVNGRECMHKLSLGWYVLRNRSEDERSLDANTRDANEERFFQTGAWRNVSPASRGVESLRKRLSKVLLDHIKASLPGLIREIEENLRSRQEKLERLGRSRSTPEEMRSYLLSIADDFQRLARDAIAGRYSDPFFGGLFEDGTKLRAILRNLNRAFDVVLRTKGARYDIQWEGAVVDADSDGNGETEEIPEYLKPFISLYDIPGPEPIAEADLAARLEIIAAGNQGKEFPDIPNSELALQLFKLQAKRWQDIAEVHLNHVLAFTKAFVERAFTHIIGADERTSQNILASCVDPFFDEKRDVLRHKLQELLCPYTEGYGLPLEGEYRTRMSRRTLRRTGELVAQCLQEEHPELFREQLAGKGGLSRQKIIRAVVNSTDPHANQFGTRNILDMMTEFYEVSHSSSFNTRTELIL